MVTLAYCFPERASGGKDVVDNEHMNYNTIYAENRHSLRIEEATGTLINSESETLWVKNVYLHILIFLALKN